jgi:hypothetical protein
MSDEALLARRLESPPLDPSPASVAGALRAAGIRACSLEYGADATPFPSSGPPSTVAEALDSVTAADSRYRWEITPEGLVNLFPSPSVLDDEVAPLPVAGKGLWSVLEEDLLPGHGIELFMEFRSGNGPAVPADLPGGTLRSALNTLIAPVGSSVWQISGNPGAHYLAVTEIA